MRFSEYARQQAGQSVDPKVEAYWVAEYSEAVPPLGFAGRPGPAGAEVVPRGDLHCYDRRQRVQRIKKVGAQHGSTLFGTLLCGFQGLLARLTGQSDIVVGVPAAAQSAAGKPVLVGHCVNFLPLRD